MFLLVACKCNEWTGFVYLFTIQYEEELNSSKRNEGLNRNYREEQVTSCKEKRRGRKGGAADD